jgi:hypothetical protein
MMNGYNGISQKNIDTVEQFISNCEQLTADASKLETLELKVLRLCHNQVLIINEITRMIKDRKNVSEVKNSPEDEAILDKMDQELMSVDEDGAEDVF